MAGSPLTPTVAGYFTPDGFRHAIVATASGSLHEVFFNSQQGKGVARLACFNQITHVAGFYSPDDDFQHEIVATPKGDIHEIFFKPNSIHFTEPPLARFNGIVGLGAFYAGDDHNRIVTIATKDGNITELFYNPSTGVHISQPALAQFNGVVSISSFYAEDDHNRIVLVATQDGSISEVFYHPSIGVHVSKPPLARFNRIVDIAAFYSADDKFRHVIVATNDGNLTEIFYHPSIGVHISQPPLARFNGIVAIAAFYTPDDHFRHVVVATNDGSVTEVFYHPSIGVHISQPSLVHFGPVTPAAQDISPDPFNLDAAALGAVNAGTASTAGRTVSIAGSLVALYAHCQRAGVWKSVANGPWTQLPNSPLEAQLFGPSSIAVDPNNSAHVVVGNADGAWESADGGATWKLAINPTKQGWNGCQSSVINAVQFGPDSTLFLGIDCGLVRRLPNAAFELTSVPAPVTAFALSVKSVGAGGAPLTGIKVWARTANSVMFSTTNGAQWSAPIPTPNGISFGSNQIFSLAAFDNFAFMTFSKAGDGGCGASNWLLVFNAQQQAWSTQRVNFNGQATCDGTGGEVDGRKFVKSFIRQGPNLPMTVGQRLQLFYSAGQEIYQALGMNDNDGTITQWSRIAGTQGPGYTNQDPIHADIWDFHADTRWGTDPVWIAGDGGVYRYTPNNPFVFPGGGWTQQLWAMHTHQVHTVTVLPTNPVGRSRLVYSTSDNNTWYRSSTPVVMPEPQWKLDGTLGDVNWTVGDAAAPRYALAVRHQEAAIFIHYDAKPELLFCTLVNFWKQVDNQGNVSILGGHVTPNSPTMFQFIPSPSDGPHLQTVDAVMMVDLPLIRFDKAQNQNVPIKPNSPLAQNTNGNPVLIRNQNFDANPDMNTTLGNGWFVEIASLPAGAVGFYVGGSRQTPQYYAFTQAGELFRRSGNNWLSIAQGLVSSNQFGPAFVNPFNDQVLYALSPNAVLVSNNKGQNFAADPVLTNLVAGPGKLPMSTIAQISFNRENPSQVVVGSESGLFYSSGGGSWIDLTNVLPLPRSAITSVGTDCEAIYVSFDARSLIRIVGHK